MTENPDKIIISEFFSDDASKKAIVFLMGGRYGIDFYENSTYNHTILHGYEDKSLNYVEDAAENYVLGVSKHFKSYR